MNNDQTEIAFILDRSGSMSAIRNSAVEGYNAFLCQQQKDNALVRMSLILFDHEYTPVYRSVPASELGMLSMEQFEPRGSTALLDAMGRTIDELGQQLAQMPPAQRPGHVIVATLTDGLENSSQHFTQQMVHERIQHQKDKYDWEFLFLASEPQADHMAAQVGITGESRVQFCRTTSGSKKAFRSLVQEVETRKNKRRSS